MKPGKSLEDAYSEHARVCKQLGVEEEPPGLDRRTKQWLSFFNVCSPNRYYAEGMPLPLRPLDILDMAERLRFPGDTEEILVVTQALDYEWLESLGSTTSSP